MRTPLMQKLVFCAVLLIVSVCSSCQHYSNDQVEYWDGTFPPIYYRIGDDASLVFPIAYFPDDFSEFYSIAGYSEDAFYIGPAIYNKCRNEYFSRFIFLPIIYTRFHDRTRSPESWAMDGEFFPLFRFYSPTIGEYHEYGVLPWLNIYHDKPERNEDEFAIAGYRRKNSTETRRSDFPKKAKLEASAPKYIERKTNILNQNFFGVLWRSKKNVTQDLYLNDSATHSDRWDYIFPFFYRSYDQGESLVANVDTKGNLALDRRHTDEGATTVFPFFHSWWEKTKGGTSIFPFLYHNYSPDERQTFLFPFYHRFQEFAASADSPTTDHLTAFPLFGRYRTPQSETYAGPLWSWVQTRTGADNLYVLLWMFMLRTENENWRAGLFDQLLSYGIRGRPHLTFFFRDMLADRPRPPITDKPVGQESDTVVNLSIPFVKIEEEGRYVEYIGNDSAVRVEQFALYPFFTKWLRHSGLERHHSCDTFVTVDRSIFRIFPFYYYMRDYSQNSADFGTTKHLGPFGIYYTNSLKDSDYFLRFLWMLTYEKTDQWSKLAFFDFLGDIFGYKKEGARTHVALIDILKFFTYATQENRTHIGILDNPFRKPSRGDFTVSLASFDRKDTDYRFDFFSLIYRTPLFLAESSRSRTALSFLGDNCFPMGFVSDHMETRFGFLNRIFSIHTAPKFAIRTVFDLPLVEKKPNSFTLFPFYHRSQETRGSSKIPSAARRDTSHATYDLSMYGLLVSHDRDSGFNSAGKVDRTAYRFLPFYAYVNNKTEGASFNGVEHYGPLGLWYQSHSTRERHDAYRLLWAFAMEDTDKFNRISFCGNLFSLRTGTQAELRLLFVPIYRYKQ